MTLLGDEIKKKKGKRKNKILENSAEIWEQPTSIRRECRIFLLLSTRCFDMFGLRERERERLRERPKDRNKTDFANKFPSKKKKEWIS